MEDIVLASLAVVPGRFVIGLLRFVVYLRGVLSCTVARHRDSGNKARAPVCRVGRLPQLATEQTAPNNPQSDRGRQRDHITNIDDDGDEHDTHDDLHKYLDFTR